MNDTFTDDNDPFCELEFWTKTIGVHLSITNPLSAITAVFMSLISLIPIIEGETDSKLVPFHFYVAKASFFIMGFGSAAFHSVPLDLEALNVRDLDWIPIVLMGFSVVLLFLSHDLAHTKYARETLTVALCSCTLLWLMLQIMFMDSNTRPVLVNDSGSDKGLMWVNGLLLLPFFLILIRMSLEPTLRTQMKTGCVFVLISVVSWALNNAFCRSVTWLFFLHTVYHLSIAIAYMHLISLACVLISHGHLRMRLLYGIWPRLYPVLREGANDQEALFKQLGSLEVEVTEVSFWNAHSGVGHRLFGDSSL